MPKYVNANQHNVNGASHFPMPTYLFNFSIPQIIWIMKKKKEEAKTH